MCIYHTLEKFVQIKDFQREDLYTFNVQILNDNNYTNSPTPGSKFPIN